MIRIDVYGPARVFSLVAIGWICLSMMAAGASNAADEPDEEGWKNNLALSVTAQSGSVDTFAGALTAGTERNWTDDEVAIRFEGVYGTTRDRADSGAKNKTIQNSQGLYGSWKHLLRDRFFWASGSELSRDSTQDREVRASLRTGPGYRTWEGENPDESHFDLMAGLGYRYELYDGNSGSIPDENGSDQHLADAVVAFDYKNMLFNDRIEFSHTGSIAMPVNETAAYIIRTEIIAGVPLSQSWSFRSGVFYEYVNDVPEDQNPSTLRVTLGLGYKF